MFKSIHRHYQQTNIREINNKLDTLDNFNLLLDSSNIIINNNLEIINDSINNANTSINNTLESLNLNFNDNNITSNLNIINTSINNSNVAINTGFTELNNKFSYDNLIQKSDIENLNNVKIWGHNPAQNTFNCLQTNPNGKLEVEAVILESETPFIMNDINTHSNLQIINTSINNANTAINNTLESLNLTIDNTDIISNLNIIQNINNNILSNISLIENKLINFDKYDLRQLRSEGRCYTITHSTNSPNPTFIYINNPPSSGLNYYIYNIMLSVRPGASTVGFITFKIAFSNWNFASATALNITPLNTNYQPLITNSIAGTGGTVPNTTAYNLFTTVINSTAQSVTIDLQEEYIQIAPGTCFWADYGVIGTTAVVDCNIRYFYK